MFFFSLIDFFFVFFLSLLPLSRFEQEDDDVDGKIELQVALSKLKLNPAFTAVFDSYTQFKQSQASSHSSHSHSHSAASAAAAAAASSLSSSALVTFTQLLIELFGVTHKNQLNEILSWSQQNGPIGVLDERQKKELETLFKLYDSDNSGFIDMTEIKTHFTALGFTPADVERLFIKYDTNKDQKVDIKEFQQFYR